MRTRNTSSKSPHRLLASNASHTKFFKIVHSHLLCISEWANYYGEKQWHKDLAEEVTAELRNKLDFIGVKWAIDKESAPVRMLDYACGPGMVTRVKAPPYWYRVFKY